MYDPRDFKRGEAAWQPIVDAARRPRRGIAAASKARCPGPRLCSSQMAARLKDGQPPPKAQIRSRRHSSSSHHERWRRRSVRRVSAGRRLRPRPYRSHLRSSPPQAAQRVRPGAPGRGLRGIRAMEHGPQRQACQDLHSEADISGRREQDPSPVRRGGEGGKAEFPLLPPRRLADVGAAGGQGAARRGAAPAERAPGDGFAHGLLPPGGAGHAPERARGWRSYDCYRRPPRPPRQGGASGLPRGEFDGGARLRRGLRVGDRGL